MCIYTQVKSQRTELLKHPLVYNLIEYKWDKFGRAIFYSMLIFHILLVIFLTAFALRLLNPFSPTCMWSNWVQKSNKIIAWLRKIYINVFSMFHRHDSIIGLIWLN